MTSVHRCTCGRPVPDGYACAPCARELAAALREAAGHAEDAWTVISRQARYSAAGGARHVEADTAVAEDLRRNRVTAFGWAASIERPLAGGLRPEPLPFDASASERFYAVENTLTTWARDMDSDAASLADAAWWLAEHAEDLRHHADAAAMFDELRDACRQLVRLVDRPTSDRRLVGVCDCGAVLYARHGQAVIQCVQRTCGAVWDVERSREILLTHLDGRLLTATEAARMAAYLDSDRTTEQIRALIHSWSKRGQIAAHGHLVDDDGETRPTYRFGEIRSRLAETPRRERGAA